MKKFKKQFYGFIFVGIAVLAIGVIGAFFNFPESEAAGGAPSHGHGGWPLRSTSYCGSYSSYSLHIQQELNWLHDNLVGFRISGGKIAEDGYYCSGTANAVSNFQSWAKNEWGDSNMIVDGIVGNQTWTHMEFQVLNAEFSTSLGRHRAGQTIRYPIYGDCVGVTNNNSSHVLSPFKNSTEWTRFKNNAPGVSVNTSANCTPSGGGGSSDGGGGGSTVDGDGTRVYCLCYGGLQRYECTTTNESTFCNAFCDFNGTLVQSSSTSCSTSCSNTGC